MLSYREPKEISKVHKERYRDGIEALIKEREALCKEKRREYFPDVFEDSERYRAELREMLGWPLVDCVAEAPPRIDYCERLCEEEGHEVYRMSLEVLPGLSMTGLFYKVKKDGRRPLVIVQHGGRGTPEHIAGFENGNTSNYNNMLWRVIKQGVHAFAPQLLLWKDDYGVEFDRQEIDARLKRVGGSIAAVEIYGIERILDYFERESYVSSFGMVGLSYGGFYTLYTTALDKRIKSAISSSFFNTRDRYGWCDFVWKNSAEKFDDAEVAALIYPRRLRILIGERDPLFECSGGKESFERLKEICEKTGTDWVDFTLFDGVHELFKEDAPIEALVREIENEKL